MPRKKSSESAKPTVKQLREELERTELEFRLGSVRQLSESINFGNQFVPPWDLYPQDQGFQGYSALGSYSTPDRSNQGNLPQAYLSEQQLRWAREKSRHLSITNEFARNALYTRQNYIVGQGFQITPVSRIEDQELKPALVTAIKDWIEEFTTINQWGLMQREAVFRGDRDGECFMRLFSLENGMTRIRFVESEFVADPTGKHTYGIETDPEDIAEVLAFWIKYPEREPERVKADDIVYVKCNTDQGVKRGLPFLYPIHEMLNRIEKLDDNMGLLAAIQASIALIRKNSVARSASIQTNRSANASYTQTNVLTGNTEYMRQMRGGQILDVDGGTDYEFPAAGVSLPGFVAAKESMLRTAAAGCSMPEYMFTSDAGNSNFASTQIAESPAVMNFTSEQFFWAQYLGSGVYYPLANNGVIWRAMERAVGAGRLPEEVLSAVRLDAKGPQIEVRDKNSETDRQIKMEQSGIISNDQAAQALGHKQAHKSSQEKKAEQESDMKKQVAAKTLKESLDVVPKTKKAKQEAAEKLHKDWLEAVAWAGLEPAEDATDEQKLHELNLLTRMREVAELAAKKKVGAGAGLAVASS